VKPSEPPQDQYPGVKIIIAPNGTAHAWTLGEEKTMCGRTIEGAEIAMNDGTQSISKFCGACEKAGAK